MFWMCWALATVAAVEGINCIRNNKQVSLSEQQIIDALPKIYHHYGRNPEDAFQYILENGGIVAEKSYTYLRRKREMKLTNYEFKDGYERVPQDEHALLKAVARQPVVVSIAADEDFEFHRRGILRGPRGFITEDVLNHSMICVGYDLNPYKAPPYWIVKNSHGRGWGENGYGKILFGGPPGGVYGIALEAYYPLKTSANTERGPRRILKYPFLP